MARRIRHSIFIGCEGADETEIFNEIHSLNRDIFNVFIKSHNTTGGGPLPIINETIKKADSGSYDKIFCVLDRDKAEDEGVINKVEELGNANDIHIVWAYYNLEDEIYKVVLNRSSTRLSKAKLVKDLELVGGNTQIRNKIVIKMREAIEEGTIERSSYFKVILDYIKSQEKL